MSRATLLLCLVLSTASHAATPWAEVPADHATATVRQSILPALEARKAAASTRLRDANAFMAGEVSLLEAFPELANTDLGDPMVIDGRLATLDQVGAQRESSRHAPLPPVGTLQRPLKSAWMATLDAEGDADQAKRRVLQALRGVLDAHPQLQSRAIAASISELVAAFEAARAEASTASGPERAAAIAKLSELEDARTRTWTLADTLRIHLIRGTEPPSPDSELAVLAKGSAGPVAQAAWMRLRLMGPWLDEKVGVAAREAETAWVDEVVRPLKMAELDRLQAALGNDQSDLGETFDLEETARALAEASRVFESKPDGEDGSVAAIDKSLAYVDMQIADVRHDLALEFKDRVASAEQLKALAAAAKAEADVAAAAPDQDPLDVMRTASLSWTADAAAKVGTWRDGLKTARDARSAVLQDVYDRIEGLADKDVQESLAIDPDFVSPDLLASRLRGEIEALGAMALKGEPSPSAELSSMPQLASAAERRNKIRAWERAAESLPETERNERMELIAATRDAISAESKPAVTAGEIGTDYHLETLERLYEARAAKVSLEPYLSPDARDDDRERLFEDVQREIALLPTQGKALLIDRVQGLQQLPQNLRRLVTRVVTDSVLSIVVVMMWLWVRRRRRAIAEQILDAAAPWFSPSPTHRQAHIRAVERPIVPAANCLMAWLAAGEAGRILPELGILVTAFGLASLVRLALGVLLIFIAKTSEPRPTLATASDASYALLSRMFGLMGTWWVVGWTLNRLLVVLAQADAVASIVRLTLFVVGASMALFFLRRWEVAFERRVRRAEDVPGWVKRWLDLPSGRWFSPARSAVFGAFLTGWAAWDLAQGTAARGDGYGALAGMMDQWRFVEADENKWSGRPLGAEERAKMLSGDVPDSLIVPREGARDTLLASFRGWREEARRGTVVVTGDRGDGKNVFLSWVGPRLSIDGSEPTRGRVERRLRTEADAIGWFSEYFGLTGEIPDVDTLTAKVCEQPGAVHIIEDVERAFLRNVGGFDALRTFLYVCNATSEQHFWVLVVHRPAWAYLSRLGSLMNTGVVRSVIDLEPLTAPQLRDMMKRRTEWVGIEVDFRKLQNRGPFGALPEVEEERAITSYFRLLVEASGGCPLVALRLWTDSLRKRWDGKADVTVTPELAANALGDMALGDLFVLTALRTQDRLSLHELVAVVNAPPDDVRATVRQLEHRGIVHVNAKGFRIDDAQLKSVTRTLRRRHFLQWAV